MKQESKQESKKEVQQQRQEDEQQKQRKRQEEKPLDQRKEVYTPPPTSAPAVAQVASAAAEHVAVLATAAALAVPMRTKRMPLVLGMIDGSELHYAGEVSPDPKRCDVHWPHENRILEHMPSIMHSVPSWSPLMLHRGRP